MINRIRAAFALLILTFAALAISPAPASAAYGDCYNYPGTVCLTANANWGTPVWRQYPEQITGCRALTGFNDITTMVRNGAPHHIVTLYEHGDCTGQYFDMPSGQWTDLSGTWWNDRLSGISVIAL